MSWIQIHTDDLKYTSNYAGFDDIERKTAPTTMQALFVNVRPSGRLATIMLLVDVLCFCILCWAFYEILDHMFAMKHTERWIAASTTAVGCTLFTLVILLRVRYVLQSKRRKFCTDITWHLQHIVRPLLVVPVIMFSAFTWVSYRVQWNSASSLSLVIVLFIAKQLNALIAYKHHRIVKNHLARLGGAQELRNVAVVAAAPPFEYGGYPTVPIVTPEANWNPITPRSTAGETIYQTSPMVLDEGSGVDTFQFKDREVPLARKSKQVPPIPLKKAKKPMQLHRAEPSPRQEFGAGATTSRTSLDEAEQSDTLVDDPYYGRA